MQGPNECIPASELTCILSILKPYQSLLLHVVRSQQDPLIQWYIVQMEKLLSFVHLTRNLGNSSFTILVVKTESWCACTLGDTTLVREFGLACHLLPTLEKVWTVSDKVHNMVVMESIFWCKTWNSLSCCSVVLEH